MQESVSLVVDLGGTLVPSNLLLESVIVLAKRALLGGAIIWVAM